VIEHRRLQVEDVDGPVRRDPRRDLQRVIAGTGSATVACFGARSSVAASSAPTTAMPAAPRNAAE
jgi:hypothetical protein